MSMASSFDRRDESVGMTDAAADALIRDHADRAYWEARRKSWDADSEANVAILGSRRHEDLPQERQTLRLAVTL